MLKAENQNKQIIIKKIDENTINIRIFDNKMLMAIVGEFNSNLNEIESLTNTKLFFRGNSITAKGKKDDIVNVSETFKYLVNKFQITNTIDNGDITYSIKNIVGNLEEKDKNNIRPLGQVIKTPKRSVVPRSKKQSEYLDALLNEKIVISLGPAGTGKSYLAVSVGVKMLFEKKIERVILSRPAVEAGERLGFLPGDMKDKVDPYLRPLYDALYDLFGFEKIQKKIETGEIEIAPLAFMRGRTLKNSYAILDEAQNASLTQIKMFLTRIGENSKLVVNGDPTQIDLINKNQSGLEQTKKILQDINEIKFVEFTHNDVARHPLVAKIVRAYQKNINNDKS